MDGTSSAPVSTPRTSTPICESNLAVAEAAISAVFPAVFPAVADNVGPAEPSASCPSCQPEKSIISSTYQLEVDVRREGDTCPTPISDGSVSIPDSGRNSEKLRFARADAADIPNLLHVQTSIFQSFFRCQVY